MTHRKRFAAFTLMEVLIALVILGIVTLIVFRTSVASIHDTGRASDWQHESAVVEKTIEWLRKSTDAPHLKSLDSSATDSSNGVKIRVSVKGSTPPTSICALFPCANVARVSVTARRTGFNDSMVVSTYLFAKAP